MRLDEIPRKFPIPWGESASSDYIRAIPVESMIGIEDGAASLRDGFPPKNFQDSKANGSPAPSAAKASIFVEK